MIALAAVLGTAPSAWAVTPAGPEPAPPFEALCFQDFDEQADAPSGDAMKRLLVPVSGSTPYVSEERGNLKRGLRLSGLARLAEPWQPDMAVRMALLPEPGGKRPFQLLVWSGRQGVALRRCQEGLVSWAAYGITRTGDQPRPDTWALWATDEDRFRRSGGGTWELHYQDGKLVMTRGDVALLRVPLPGAPREVYFDGSATILGLALFRTRGLPPPPAQNSLVLHQGQPAALDWQPRLAQGVAFHKLDDGRVELAAEGKSTHGSISAAICDPGLYEYIVEVEDAQPGTGVFLGDEQGEPLVCVAFYRDKSSGQTLFSLLPGYVVASGRPPEYLERAFPPDRGETFYAGAHQWLRLLLAHGVARAWTSGDGVDWSSTRAVPSKPGGPCRQVGLCCFGGSTRRGLKLRSVTVRRLDAFAALVPTAIADRLEPPPETDDLQRWLKQVDADCPAGVAPQGWRRGCMVAALARCRSHAFGQALLYRLLDDVLAEPAPLETRLRLLEQAGWLIGANKDPHGLRQSAYYEQLGQMAIRQHQRDPFTQIVRAGLQLPAWSGYVSVFSPALLRYELMLGVSQERWADVDGLLRRVGYWTRNRGYGNYPVAPLPDVGYLLDWAQALVAEHLKTGTPAGRSLPPAAGHPLVERWSKEDYNIAAEFQAALAGHSYREACQIISSPGGIASSAAVPSPADPALATSLPVAAEAAMAEAPALRQMMQQQFGALGQLRVKQATAAGQAPAVEAVAQQFPGTAAAAEAGLWLGDRALAAGRFAAASADFRAALRSAEPPQQSAIRARLRLAAALQGISAGPPADEPVTLGQQSWSAAEFERLIAGIRRAHAPPGGSSTAGAGSSDPGLLPAGHYQCRRWAHFDVVEEQAEKRPAGPVPGDFDWAGYRLRAVLAGQSLVVAGPASLVALDLHDGRPAWRQDVPPDDAHLAWAAPPMQPIAAGSWIFVRRLTREGVVLVALDRVDGQLLWISNPREEIVCDPLWIEPELFAISAVRGERETLTLQLTRLDPGSGSVTARYPLADFHDVWPGAVSCRAVAVDDKILVSVGGCVLSCSTSGRVGWLRRQTYVPGPHEVSWSKERRPPRPGRPSFESPATPLAHDPPCVDQAQLYAAQPGGWELECLDLDTGRLRWRQIVANLVRVRGISGGALIVETSDELCALDRQTGKPLWSRTTRGPLVTLPAGPNSPTVILEQDLSAGSSDSRPTLAWLDPATGRTTASAVLELPAGNPSRLGPVVAAGGRVWVFFAADRTGSGRDLWELIPGDH